MPIPLIRGRKVSDESGYTYEIGKVLYEMPDSEKIYRIIGHEDKVYVEVPNMLEHRNALINMCNKNVYTPCFEKILWPEKLVQENKGFISLNPGIHGELLSLAEIIEDRKTKTSLDHAEKLYYLSLGIQLARIVDVVHNCGYVVGVMTPTKFYVSDDGTLYSLSSYQFSFMDINAFDNPYYVSPEWLLTMNNEPIRYTKQSDAYLYATILFQLLTGKYPFASERNISEVGSQELWELMSDGKSLYYWEDEDVISAVKEELRGLPPDIEKLFERTFDYCGYYTYDEKRPSISEWLQSL